MATWKVKSGDKVTVPDIKFTPIVVHRPYLKTPRDSLEKIVVVDRRGCDSFDKGCQQYIQNLNSHLPGSINDAYNGEIMVPTKAYRAVITLLPQGTDFEMNEISKRNDSDGDEGTGLHREEYSREPLSAIPALKDHVVPSAKATLHQEAPTSIASTAEGSRSLLLTLVHHPLATGTSLSLGPTARVNIAVFDTPVDKTHCLIGNLTVLDPDGLGSISEAAAHCGDRGDYTEANDHGTHVVGLIGMRTNGQQGPGTNPYATITALSINPDKFRSPLYLATQSDRLRALFQTVPPDVVNMSFEYNLSTEEGKNDVFHEAMKELNRRTLFVVSAGNDGAALNSNGDCRVRPACYDDPNIITVGALNLDPNAPALMSFSNYGDRVHVAAPGENILSTIAGNRIGITSGTSQAAPTVAGAASLLFLYEHPLSARQVKNRIIYTSDLFPSLFGKIFGGRLNVQRLLAYKLAIVDTTDGGHIEASLHTPGTYLVFDDFDTNEEFQLQIVQVRRLMLNPSLGYYTLFYNDEAGRDTGLLKRRSVILKSPAAKVLFGVPTELGMPERAMEITAQDIVDYVSPLLL